MRGKVLKLKGKFFSYRQNNSGGHMVVSDNIGELVVVEAKNAEDADRRAKKIGLYFDGRGDCPCCGCRWTSAEFYEQKGTDKPEDGYGKNVGDLVVGTDGNYFTRNVRIHYLDGNVARISVKR